jgi:hypothetical protein
MELFSGDLDLEQLELNPRVLPENSARNQAGPIAQFDIHLFRWLTALRSSAIQTSRPIRDFVMI